MAWAGPRAIALRQEAHVEVPQKKLTSVRVGGMPPKRIAAIDSAAQRFRACAAEQRGTSSSTASIEYQKGTVGLTDADLEAEEIANSTSYIEEVKRIDERLRELRQESRFLPALYLRRRDGTAEDVRRLLRCASKSFELNMRFKDIERLDEMHSKLWELLSAGGRTCVTAEEYQTVMRDFNMWRLSLINVAKQSQEGHQDSEVAIGEGPATSTQQLRNSTGSEVNSARRRDSRERSGSLAASVDLTRKAESMSRPVDEDTALGEVLYMCCVKLPRPTMELFLHGQRNLFNSSAVDITSIYQLFAKRVSLVKSEAELMMWDTNNDGKLSEDEIENYMQDLVPRIAALRDISEAVLPFYCCTACRRILWDLDPGSRGIIRINALLASPVMDEWVSMQLLTEDNPQNWFGATVTQQVYEKFMFLDTRGRGTLNGDCLRRYKKGLPTVIDDGLPFDVSPLSTLFIDRYFETNIMMTNSEMDYRKFVDFVIAVELLPQCSRPHFFWRIFDLEGTGALTPLCVNYFFRETHAKLVSAGLDVPPREVVVQEVFDLIPTAEPLRITREEFVNSPQAGLFVALIIDCLSFWTYENREQR